MNSDLMGTERQRVQLQTTVLAGSLQSLEFVQQVVGLFTLSAIVQRPVAQFVSIPDSSKGNMLTIEQIEAEPGGERG
jgi:hypothetical protein